MAKHYTIAEGFAALKKGDPAARADIARRFPLFATATAEEIVSSIEMLTARQAEKQLRMLHAAKLGEVEAEETEPVKKAKKDKPAKEDKPAKGEKAAKKSKKAKDEDEDEDEDEKPVKKSKKKAKDEDEDEDDDFDPADLFEDDEDDDD